MKGVVATVWQVTSEIPCLWVSEWPRHHWRAPSCAHPEEKFLPKSRGHKRKEGRFIPDAMWSGSLVAMSSTTPCAYWEVSLKNGSQGGITLAKSPSTSDGDGGPFLETVGFLHTKHGSPPQGSPTELVRLAINNTGVVECPTTATSELLSLPTVSEL